MAVFLTSIRRSERYTGTPAERTCKREKYHWPADCSFIFEDEKEMIQSCRLANKKEIDEIVTELNKLTCY